MTSACLPPYTHTSPFLRKILSPQTQFGFFHNNQTCKKVYANSIRCRSSSSSSSSIDFDLYDLLGIDSSSDQSQIKSAYRSLQKRCHPDIAGPAGHDMAILLNEVYSVLSDPSSRLAYDKEQAKVAELRGYTGKPIYSVWLGSENEERAVFVDEVKCVGCLKCALFAEKTFAIESVYGRARVVAQWADPEPKILEAIETCPVDCISIVGRSDLAALEFLMSKQPRGNVRIGMGNAAGARVSNIFIDVKKFQNRAKDAMDQSSANHSKETDLQREARMSAIQAIRSISNWLYWHNPNAARSSTTSGHKKLKCIAAKSTKPDMDKLREAVAARKQAKSNTTDRNRTTSSYINHEEYWIPTALAFPDSTRNNKKSPKAIPLTSPPKKLEETEQKYVGVNENKTHPMKWGVPMGMAMVAAAIVRLQVVEEKVGGLKEHIGGSAALEIVNSSAMQIILAGITWYLFGMAIIGILEGIGRKERY